MLVCLAVLVESWLGWAFYVLTCLVLLLLIPGVLSWLDLPCVDNALLAESTKFSTIGGATIARYEHLDFASAGTAAI